MCTTRRNRRLTTPAALVALAVALPTALGQNALGDGRALDANLSTQTRYNAQRVDPGAEYRFRNAVATGNAPGGLSLRADVGYRSAYEFRGELGSDDLFSFRRDSLYSGLAGMGIRGTDAIQYQFALTTGARLPQNIVGSDILSRDGSRGDTATLPSPTGSMPLRRPTAEEQLESERLTGLLRSPSTYDTTRSMRPVFLGNVANLAGEVNEQGVSASGLRGIRIVEMGSSVGYVAGSVARSPAGTTNQPTTSELAQGQRVRTAYDTVIESQQQRLRINAAADAPEAEAVDDWRSRLDALRQRMQFGEPGAAQPGVNPGQGTPEGEAPSGEAPGTAPAAPGNQPRFDPETMNVLRSTSPTIETLVELGSPLNSVYVSHMETGQHLLKTGRFFDAEERFTRAISMRPGDVSAQVGRLHAQLGAGLFISAGLNLRELVVTSPEIAATRFGAELLPDETRAEGLVKLLRERAGLVEGRIVNDLTLQRETGLLLAYLSFQRDDTAGVAEGLGAAASTLSEQELSTQEVDDRLITYLRALWLPVEDAGLDSEPASGAEAEPQAETAPDSNPDSNPDSESEGG